MDGHKPSQEVAKAEAPPPAAPAPSARDRLRSFHPLRDFLAHHDLHHLPHRVSHSRRARRALLAALVALLVFGSWWSVIPRADVVVEAQYHEGLFNKIAVDMRVVNGGSVALAPLRVTLVVTDMSTNASVGFASVNTTLAAHRTLAFDAVEFKGDQLTTRYAISIVVTFDSGAGRFAKTLDFRTEEPYMNLYFAGRVA